MSSWAVTKTDPVSDSYIDLITTFSILYSTSTVWVGASGEVSGRMGKLSNLLQNAMLPARDLTLGSYWYKTTE